MRFLQIDSGVATAELETEAIPIDLPAGRSFVNVTNRPEGVLFGLYDADTDTFSSAPALPPINPLDKRVTARETRSFMKDLRANTKLT